MIGPLDRLVTLPQDEPPLTLGWAAAKWAMRYLRQPNGPRAGAAYRPTDSQVQFLLHFYALDRNGDWLYRRAVRRLAKGSGKSPFAAVLSLIELCAPVRLHSFDENVRGGCVGKAVSMPLVQIAATAESQTQNTMRMVRAFAPKGSKVALAFGLDPGTTRYYKSGGGKLEVISSSSRAAEGAEATFIVGDEPEHWVPGNGGPAFVATLADNLAKSGSRMLETCNAWVPGEQSVAEASFASWVEQEEGRSRGESHILYDARVAPPDTDLTDDASLTAALSYVYDDCWWVNLAAIKERIWDVQAQAADSRRKFLNQPTADEKAWLAPHEWSRIADPTFSVARDEPVVLFFDGSKSRDATALVACTMADGYVLTLGVWEPDPAHTSEDTVDASEVDSAVIAAFEDYDVVAFFADVAEWQGFVKVTWPDRWASQLAVWASPATREPCSIAWDMRTHAYDFAEAAETCHEEIVSETFRHDGNPATARHVLNATRRPYKGRITVAKESHDSPRKIDACVCVIGARMARRIVLNSKTWQRRSRNNGSVVFLR